MRLGQGDDELWRLLSEKDKLKSYLKSGMVRANLESEDHGWERKRSRRY
jgi:hypothetical protein